MKGKRKFLTSVMVFCFGLVGFSSWLILNPAAAFADELASCTATCKGGRTVSCGGGNATGCVATDGVGCTSNKNGGEAKSCNSSGDVELEDPPQN